MSESTTPRRIEWAAPEGWTIWADEDGVHLRSRSGDCMEQPDALKLVDLYNRVRSDVVGNAVQSPKPPTREQFREMETERRARYMARTAARAVESAINPPHVPF